MGDIGTKKGNLFYRLPFLKRENYFFFCVIRETTTSVKKLSGIEMIPGLLSG
jgi:hypothetical protein